MFGLSKKTLLLLGIALLAGAKFASDIKKLPVVGGFVS